jgi:serine phosphatase RsbU (regulator of sigma subunit)/tetratricopeptide (TPR) repeat protein
MQYRSLCLTFFLFFYSMSWGKTSIDSLEKLLSSKNSDKERLLVIKQLIESTRKDDLSRCISYSADYIEIAEKSGENAGFGYFNLGVCYENSQKPELSLQNYFKAVQAFEKEKGKENERGAAKTYDYIGGIYVTLKSYKQAAIYKNKAIELYKKINDKEGEAVSSFNLGNIFLMEGNLDDAIKIIEASLSVFSELEDEPSIAQANNSIGAIYYNKSQFDKALTYFKNAYKSKLKFSDSSDFAIALLNIGETYDKMGVLDSALAYEEQARKICEKKGLLTILPTNYENLSAIYEKLKDYPRSIEYSRMAMMIKDSIYKLESQQQLQELSVKYLSDKKESENKILNLQLDNERSTKYILSIASFLILISTVFIWRAYRGKKRTNKELELKNIIIEEKNKLVESKNKDIGDSIQYARRIQVAILPPDRLWYSTLPDSFVLYKPKDVLSGDFYWIEETEKHIFFAAADCTGHGVPGALMSVVNFNLLNKAVLEKGILNPAQILNEVNTWLTVALHQTYQESAVRDGMDISLCAINKETKEIQFAGANNPIYFIKDGKLRQLSGDKFPVGAYIEEKQQKFTNNTIPRGEVDVLYIFSDGYADQFGGPKGKKFKYKQFQEKILGMQDLTLQKQKHELNRIFEDWKGEFEQIDDVLVIGVNLITV